MSETDFIGFFARAQQRQQIVDKVDALFPDPEEEDQRRSNLVGAAARERLAAVEETIKDTYDDVVTSIQHAWDFVDGITSDTDDTEPEVIMERITKLRARYDQLADQVAELRRVRDSTSATLQDPKAAAAELLRRFPALNKTGAPAPEPQPEEKAEGEPQLLPTGQVTRRTRNNVFAFDRKSLEKKFPALRR